MVNRFFDGVRCRCVSALNKALVVPTILVLLQGSAMKTKKCAKGDDQKLEPFRMFIFVKKRICKMNRIFTVAYGAFFTCMTTRFVISKAFMVYLF